MHCDRVNCHIDLVSILTDFNKLANSSYTCEHSIHHTSMSAAWRSGSERRFYDDHDRKVDGSPPNLVSLLRPWIRCFTMIISAWWNLASSKSKKKVRRKFKRKTWKQRQLLSESGFVLRIAPPSLSRDRRIKMKKSIKSM